MESRAEPFAGEKAAPLVFDRRRTLSLCQGNADLARDLSALFLETAGDLVGGLHEAVDGADPEAVESLAHTLKGSAANLSGERIMATAKRLMRIGRRGVLDGAREVLAQLDEELAQLERALAAFRSELGEGRA